MNIEAIKNSKILIVDDNPSNLSVLFKALNKYFQVSVAVNGKLALEIARKKEPDIILLDIVMPEMDGFEVCEVLKSEEITKNIPVIFMSALSETSDKVRGFDVGAVDYITKPFQHQEVISRVSSHLTIRHQQRELAELYANKDKIYSIIAHDLRRPLSSFMILSQNFADSLDSLTKDEIQESFDNINSSVQRAIGLLDNLLQWSKIETIRSKFVPESFEINTVIHDAISLYRTTAEQKDITIHNNIDEKISVYADKQMINVVMRNLISNAIKFSHKESAVQISVYREVAFVKVSVKDMGVGISEDKLQSLFDPEKHFSTTGTQNEIGSGLGLVFCKEFIEKNGGELTVESKVDSGSTFSFTLPRM